MIIQIMVIWIQLVYLEGQVDKGYNDVDSMIIMTMIISDDHDLDHKTQRYDHTAYDDLEFRWVILGWGGLMLTTRTIQNVQDMCSIKS